MNKRLAAPPDWPALPYAEWADTCATLHLWTQIVGKIRMAHAPAVNHWWHVPLYVASRGLTTSPIPYGARSFQIDFDFIDHRLNILASDGAAETIALEPKTVAEFYAELMRRLRGMDLETPIWTMPVEIEHAIPFDADTVHTAYDPAYANRFWRVLVQVDRVLNRFRSRFIGKVSPVHFFWGSFDMAVTRFSGRLAPPLSAASPNLGEWVMREAYSHEVSRAAFYSYAYPEPPGFAEARVQPEATFYDPGLGQLILPYDEFRESASPDDELMRYLQGAYDAAADLGMWDRSSLERQAR
jgi:hypothetical protein